MPPQLVYWINNLIFAVCYCNKGPRVTCRVKFTTDIATSALVCLLIIFYICKTHDTRQHDRHKDIFLLMLHWF